MLALASMRSEPNLRVEQASDWALRKRWIGASDEDRAMLALAVRANSARTVIEPDLLRLAAPAQLRQAVTWGLATRLCRRMTGLAPAALAETSLSVGDGRLVLAARGELAGLFTETVAKDLRLLAENLALTPQFRAIEPGAALP
jgi:exopolyphosphatase/guanosine-5'-triphosphate,3'-diphosphate pyrophosphatase